MSKESPFSLNRSTGRTSLSWTPLSEKDSKHGQNHFSKTTGSGYGRRCWSRLPLGSGRNVRIGKRKMIRSRHRLTLESDCDFSRSLVRAAAVATYFAGHADPVGTYGGEFPEKQ